MPCPHIIYLRFNLILFHKPVFKYLAVFWLNIVLLTYKLYGTAVPMKGFTNKKIKNSDADDAKEHDSMELYGLSYGEELI